MADIDTLPTASATLGRVLVVDDDPLVRRAYVRVLGARGLEVVEACDGGAAAEALRAQTFDAIVSDVAMPRVGGLELLRTVRTRDLDVPVILITGNATVETAVAAVEHGALRYLVKPVDGRQLAAEVLHAVSLGRMARLHREAARHAGIDPWRMADRATRELVFPAALKGLWMAWQPIVGAATHATVAYEALVRTDEPSLADPGALFGTAEDLNRLQDLGRVIRSEVASSLCAGAPDGVDFYVNLHASDLWDDRLFEADAPLSAWARRVVLEITERASLQDPSAIPARIRDLRSLGYRIAIDDLGAGYATLSWFTVLTPDVAKLDMSLVRGVDHDPVRRKLVGGMVALCKDLGVRVVAEGVECVAERDAVVDLGCELLQGYHFARPQRDFAPARW